MKKSKNIAKCLFNKIGNFIDTNGLKKRFAQTDNTTGNFTEKSFIWNIYETIRPKYIEKIKIYCIKIRESKKKKNTSIILKQKLQKKS
ncbi:hypothetical protein NWQ33_04740 [Mycoplasmopsis cynos]|nr:hypothetical protein [Mycoplasmopsis cynos]